LVLSDHDVAVHASGVDREESTVDVVDASGLDWALSIASDTSSLRAVKRAFERADSSTVASTRWPSNRPSPTAGVSHSRMTPPSSLWAVE
jgi:hypothetical protein